VVVLDEATSNLDPVAERRAEEAFSARHGTLIVIAHRLSSALRARRVLVLDSTSATLGDHPTLLATSPLYRQLFGAWDGEDTASPRSAGTSFPERPRAAAAPRLRAPRITGTG
jgi:ATP-binding cassette subfamily C protein